MVYDDISFRIFVCGVNKMTVINARICVLYDTLENWRKRDSESELMEGELVAVKNEDGTVQLMVGGAPDKKDEQPTNQSEAPLGKNE